MDDISDTALMQALAALAPAGVLIAADAIQPQDADALLPSEALSIDATTAASRRASGAARRLARGLLQRFGHAAHAIIKGASGAPVWPKGLVGSLAHDEAVAVATVGRDTTLASLGVDVEPLVPLGVDLLDLVLTARERDIVGEDLLLARGLFAAKEATYKAVQPLTHRFLEFQDIEIDVAAGTATPRFGPRVEVRLCRAPRIVALALVAR